MYKKLGRYRTYINIADESENILGAMATTVTKALVASAGTSLPYSKTATFIYAATVQRSLSTALNTKIIKKALTYSEMFISAAH